MYVNLSTPSNGILTRLPILNPPFNLCFKNTMSELNKNPVGTTLRILPNKKIDAKGFCSTHLFLEPSHLKMLRMRKISNVLSWCSSIPRTKQVPISMDSSQVNFNTWVLSSVWSTAVEQMCHSRKEMDSNSAKCWFICFYSYFIHHF